MKDNLVTYKGERYCQVGEKDGKATFENRSRTKYFVAIQKENGLQVIGTGYNMKELSKFFTEVE